MSNLFWALLIFLFIGGGVAALVGGGSDYHGNDTEMCQ